ncbi:MAG: GIY-YIG nuclease family protein [Massilia sp.]
MDKTSYVYILASSRYGTLYTGATSDLIKRVWQHKSEVYDGFTKTYHVRMLVWYEIHGEIMAAVKREHQIKHWKRAWKMELIAKLNPLWRDLYDEIVG